MPTGLTVGAVGTGALAGIPGVDLACMLHTTLGEETFTTPGIPGTLGTALIIVPGTALITLGEEEDFITTTTVRHPGVITILFITITPIITTMALAQ